MRTILLCSTALLLISPPVADGGEAEGCPPAVTTAVTASYPGARITTCRAEREEGEGASWDVLIETTDHRKIELGLAADGKLLEVEESIDLAAVPPQVMDAFRAKFPKEKAAGAAKEQEGGNVYYAVSFGNHEAKFGEDGTFVEDEQEDD